VPFESCRHRPDNVMTFWCWSSEGLLGIDALNKRDGVPRRWYYKNQSGNRIWNQDDVLDLYSLHNRTTSLFWNSTCMSLPAISNSSSVMTQGTKWYYNALWTATESAILLVQTSTSPRQLSWHRSPAKLPRLLRNIYHPSCRSCRRPQPVVGGNSTMWTWCSTIPERTRGQGLRKAPVRNGRILVFNF